MHKFVIKAELFSWSVRWLSRQRLSWDSIMLAVICKIEIIESGNYDSPWALLSIFLILIPELDNVSKLVFSNTNIFLKPR